MENLSERLKQLYVRANELWSKSTLNQRVLFSGALVLVIVSLVVVFSNSKKIDFEPLYTELNDRDAAAIVEKLNEYRVPYQLADNGTTILVSGSNKHQTRLQLASDNLPRGTVGFEIFQESSFGETQTDKKVKYQMALQGELERTIQSLDKISSARVHLSLPEATLFSDNEELPSASVTLRIRDNVNLTNPEVRGIVNLVSNSIEKLYPENVVVVDQNANILSDNINSIESNMDVLDRQLILKRQFEREKQQVIQSMLDKTLGKDNSVVRVSAELNFNSVEQIDERYFHDSEGPFIRSEEIIKESGEQTSENPQGVPAVDGNVPEYLGADNQTGSSSYDNSHVTRNYEINRTETLTTFAIGDVKYDYLTVAVLVNNSVATQALLGANEQERIEKIRSIVATAAGLREDRNNENVRLDENIAVTFMDFYMEPEVVEPSSPLNELLKSPFAPWVIIILALLVIIFAWMLVRRQPKINTNELVSEEQDFKAIIDDELRIEDIIDLTLTPEEKQRQKVKQEIEKIVDDNAENAAQVIKSWLSEDSR